MTRETKAERIAREAAELAAYHEKFVAEYPDRLLNLVYQYGTLGADFRIRKIGSLFHFQTDHRLYRLPDKIIGYGLGVDDELQSAEYEVEQFEREEVERRRLRDVVVEAKRKIAELLTDEERKVMGL